MTDFSKVTNRFTNLMLVMALVTGYMSAMDKEIKYPVSGIPENLKTNARAVIRNDEMIMSISAIDEVTIRITKAITILNEHALDKASLIEYYNKFRKIHNISGTVYNAEGEKVEQLSQDEIIDHSAISMSSLFEDTRVKYYEPRYRRYPFTVEYDYEIRLHGFLDLPNWIPCSDNYLSVQHAFCKITVNDPISFRFKNKNAWFEPEITKADGRTIYSWKMENQPALIEEPWCESFLDYSPGVLFAPDSIEVDNYGGNINSWKSFGLWIYKINKGRDQLSEETRKILSELVQDCPDDYHKAKKVYEYMQTKTRYVSIQIGIGGWQPYDAESVDRLGYGDCKALTNYFKALLAEVGIKSYYTLVLAGDHAPSVMKEFPSQQFNHAILCLPVNIDTIWVECTNQNLPFGYNGTFTDDRDVLIIKETGGELIHTNVYDASQNIRYATSELLIDNSGNAEIKMETAYGGMFFDEKFPVYQTDLDTRKESIYKDLKTPGIVLDSFGYSMITGKYPIILEALKFLAPSFCNQTGTRLLVQFNRLTQGIEVPKRVSERKSDICIKRSYVLVDTLILKTPGDYKVESIPAPANLMSVFGNCEYQYFLIDNKVVYVRKMAFTKGEYSSSEYQAFIEFLKRIAFQDAAKMSLIKRGA